MMGNYFFSILLIVFMGGSCKTSKNETKEKVTTTDFISHRVESKAEQKKTEEKVHPVESTLSEDERKSIHNGLTIKNDIKFVFLEGEQLVSHRRVRSTDWALFTWKRWSAKGVRLGGTDSKTSWERQVRDLIYGLKVVLPSMPIGSKVRVFVPEKYSYAKGLEDKPMGNLYFEFNLLRLGAKSINDPTNQSQ